MYTENDKRPANKMAITISVIAGIFIVIIIFAIILFSTKNKNTSTNTNNINLNNNTNTNVVDNSNINETTNTNENINEVVDEPSTDKVFDINSYIGTWYYYDNETDGVSKSELTIKEYDEINETIVFDYEIYDVTSFNDIEATLDNTVAQFTSKDEKTGYSISGYLSFNDDVSIFIVDSSYDKVPTGLYTHTTKID